MFNLLFLHLAVIFYRDWNETATPPSQNMLLLFVQLNTSFALKYEHDLKKVSLKLRSSMVPKIFSSDFKNLLLLFLHRYSSLALKYQHDHRGFQWYPKILSSDFYDQPENEKRCRIEPPDLLGSTYCAAVYDKEWSRAVIEVVTGSTTCRVFYIDYGSMRDVSINDVRFVHILY